MIDFPTRTMIHRRMPKEMFYKNLQLSPVLKARFVSDIERIVIENSLTSKNLNLEKETAIKEILLLSIILKKQVFDGRILEAIVRQNAHKLIFRIAYEGQEQLAIYHGKLYRSAWLPETDTNLTLAGNNLDDIWDDLVRQVALHSAAIRQQTDQTLERQLACQDEIDRLSKLIQKTEAAAWKEQQPKKRFALYTKLQAYKQQMEEIAHGKA